MRNWNSDSTNKLWAPLVALTFGVALVHIYFLFRTNINWDEFRFLAEIYEFDSNQDSAGLNNFHVLLFGWLKHLPFNEIGQILVGRAINLTLFFGAIALLYRLAQDPLSPIVALTCIFLTLCYSAILLHAAAFRFDPICLFFSMSSLFLLLRGKGSHSAAIAGLSLAISVLVSIKTVLWVPTFAAVALIALAFSEQKTGTTKRLLAFCAAFIIALPAFFAIHWAMSPGTQVAGEAQGRSLLQNLNWLAYAMFAMDGFLPRMTYIIRGITENPIHWLLISIGAFVALRQLIFRKPRRKVAAIALAMALPFTSIFFYRNSFPYFYVYVLPPAMMLAGLAMEAMMRRWRDQAGDANNLIIAIPVLFGVATTSLFLYFHEEGIEKQRQVNEVVHQMFPEPVPYIGAHGMISSFPRVGPFMSTLGMIRYHAEGEPVFAKGIREHEPKMLLVNHMAFYSNEDNAAEDPRQFTLLPEDKAAIHQNYILHWGPVYVAGKLFELEEGQSTIEFEIIISGEYSVESEAPVEIDGKTYEPGAVLTLNKGNHVLVAPGAERVGLRWGGGDLPYPEFAAPLEWLYDGL